MPKTIPCFQVDAFTRSPFAGNPAAVCPLDKWLDDSLMQAIAAENALSETAFFVRSEDGYELRWFTPVCEVDLCGHATLASAFVARECLGDRSATIRFQSKSGELRASVDGDALVLDFPRVDAVAIEPFDALAMALGRPPIAVSRNYKAFVACYESSEQVRALTPDMLQIMGLNVRAVMVTARGTGIDHDVDFVSRFFAPRAGIDEDPVTGSAHCTLAPLWAARLGKTQLLARQVSKRTGEMTCTVTDDRVRLRGHAVLVKKGDFLLP